MLLSFYPCRHLPVSGILEPQKRLLDGRTALCWMVVENNEIP